MKIAVNLIENPFSEAEKIYKTSHITIVIGRNNSNSKDLSIWNLM